MSAAVEPEPLMVSVVPTVSVVPVVSVVFALMVFASRFPFTVVDPVIASDVPVALAKVRKPLRVVEAEKKLVVVPFVAKNLSKVEEAA